MTFLLDTNACIRYLNGRAPAIRENLSKYSPDQIAVCSIVKAELYFGAMKSNDPAKSLAAQERFLVQFESLPFEDRAAMFYGKLRSQLAAEGTPVGPNDMLIAAIALANDLTLVSNNAREFSRIADLKWVDWEAAI